MGSTNRNNFELEYRDKYTANKKHNILFCLLLKKNLKIHEFAPKKDIAYIL